MTTSTLSSALDLSGLANFERLLEFLPLLLFGAMTFFGLCRARRTAEIWPRVLWWSALAAFAIRGVHQLVPSFRDVALRTREEAQDSLKGGPTMETWELLGTIGDLLGGACLLGCGVALIFLGKLESRTPGRKKKRARKKARS